ncbi:MAG: MFS transporter [Bryobacterales bacterium]|nr:MFS transporter [Bryobacterales bacterium]
MSTGPSVFPGAVTAPGEHRKTGLQALSLLCIAHFCIDLYSSGLSSFQPLLVDKLGLTLTEAGLLGGLLTLSSSVAQPLYGILSDRFRSRLFTALAPAVAGVFITALGVAPTYSWALALVVLGGVGIASFHPQGSAWATASVRDSHGRWMAVFISAGTFGWALGPSLLTAVISRFGFENVLWTSIPGLATTLFLLFMLPPYERGEARKFDLAPLKAVWKPLFLLYMAVFVRSVVQQTYTQFLPLYLNRERGFSLSEAAHSLTAYLVAGAIGGFVGGNLSDRFGARKVILWSFAGSVPFLALFYAATGWLSQAGLVAGGLILLFTIPVNVVVAQRLVPSQAGTISALMMGFSWGMAGLIFIPLTGWISDQFSLRIAMSSLLIFPVLGIFFTRLLPEDM